MIFIKNVKNEKIILVILSNFCLFCLILFYRKTRISCSLTYFQCLIVSCLSIYSLASFGTRWSASTCTFSFCPPYFCTKHWHSGVWFKPAREESVSSQLWWGWSLAVPKVKTEMNGLFLFSCPECTALHLSWRFGIQGAIDWVYLCKPGSVPSYRHATL